MPSPASALLAPWLAPPAAHLSSGLGLGSSQSSVGQLPDQGLMHRGFMRLNTKDCLTKLDVVHNLTRNISH
jgi:hypothetical protein